MRDNVDDKDSSSRLKFTNLLMTTEAKMASIKWLSDISSCLPRWQCKESTLKTVSQIYLRQGNQIK
jgi:DUF2075 family protein